LQLELAEQLLVHIAFSGFVSDQIPEMAHFGLADTVDASEPLLDTIGVPWQVIVYHEMRALQVQTFARGIRREEYLDEGV
jgi:hypothetical protein